MSTEGKSLNFLEEIIEADLADGKYSEIITRFPPEPNGYLHIGHAKSICLNFGLTQKYGGYTNLRFDDTNPVTEDTEYVEGIKNDIRWLGFHWQNELYASDYFEKLYAFAVKLIEKGLAYVDDSTSEEIAEQKGSPIQPGRRNKYAERSIEENLLLFADMRAGKYKDGEKTLRAKIDMASPNMQMRDPLLYRIRHAYHHRTGNEWCIYPMYDMAHGQCDSIESITHSLCSLEFVSHRELYDWLINQLEIFPSHQYEFARLNLNYTVMSKRKLLQLVNENYVTGWDDPRMPTLSGIRRRGYTPESIREFCERVGMAKRENMIDFGLLEFCVREHLNKIALRRMVVFDPIKVVITNYDKSKNEKVKSDNNPEDVNAGTREIPFNNEIFIERDDFMENPPKKFFRLAPGQMVRLKSAYIIKCDEVVKDTEGKIAELRCTYIPESQSGNDTSGIHLKGTLHWVSVKDAVEIEVREYDRLFKVENPADEEGDFKDHINTNSLKSVKGFAEPAIFNSKLDERFQFLRKGYYCLDKDSGEGKFIFNRTVTLKDNWAKESKK